jgi:hypothetical protein
VNIKTFCHTFPCSRLHLWKDRGGESLPSELTRSAIRTASLLPSLSCAIRLSVARVRGSRGSLYKSRQHTGCPVGGRTMQSET